MTTTVPADELAVLGNEWRQAADTYLSLIAACPAVRWRAREWSWRTLRLDALGCQRFGELHEILDATPGTVGGDLVAQAAPVEVDDPDAALEAAAVRVMHAYRALRQAHDPGMVMRGADPVEAHDKVQSEPAPRMRRRRWHRAWVGA